MNLKDLLLTPDPFENRPGAFAANQIGHFLVIGALPVHLGAPVTLVLALFAVWELVQIMFFKGQLWDSLEDLGFVTCGALAVLWWPATAVAAVFLAAGAARRALPEN